MKLQWTQQHCVYDTKNRRVRADAKCQRENRDGGKTRTSREHAYRIAQVIQDGIRDAPLEVCCSLDCQTLETLRCFCHLALDGLEAIGVDVPLTHNPPSCKSTVKKRGTSKRSVPKTHVISWPS